MSDLELMKAMGERIYSRRKALDMTQEALAEKLGVSVQMISNLENGKKAIRPENLLKVCEALNISADYVLTGKMSESAPDSVAQKLACLSGEELAIIDEMIEYMKNK